MEMAPTSNQKETEFSTVAYFSTLLLRIANELFTNNNQLTFMVINCLLLRRNAKFCTFSFSQNGLALFLSVTASSSSPVSEPHKHHSLHKWNGILARATRKQGFCSKFAFPSSQFCSNLKIYSLWCYLTILFLTVDQLYMGVKLGLLTEKKHLKGICELTAT
jgi:hypothetical protein